MARAVHVIAPPKLAFSHAGNRIEGSKEGSMNLEFVTVTESGVSLRFRKLPDTLRVLIILRSRGAKRERAEPEGSTPLPPAGGWTEATPG